MEDNIKKIL